MAPPVPLEQVMEGGPCSMALGWAATAAFTCVHFLHLSHGVLRGRLCLCIP